LDGLCQFTKSTATLSPKSNIKDFKKKLSGLLSKLIGQHQAHGHVSGSGCKEPTRNYQNIKDIHADQPIKKCATP
jgi:hypothetical protein